MPTAEVRRRNTLFSILLIILVGLIWLSLISIWVIYLGAQSLTLPASVFHLAIWAMPYYVAAGVSSVSAFYSRDIKRGLCEASIVSAVLYFIATIANGFYVYFANSLWARCVTGVASLDTVEKIECDNDQWLVYIQFIWSWLFLILGVICFGAFTIDAFMRFDTRATVQSYARKAKKVAQTGKKLATKPLQSDMTSVPFYG